MSLLGKYKYIINKTHPRANVDGAVYLHIIAAEEMLGRSLLPEEVVHHKDLNKLNNNPDNLIVFASKSDHSRFHKSGCDESILILNPNGSYSCEKRRYTCIDCGTEITKHGIRCSKCSKIHSRKVNRPTSDELFDELTNLNGNFTKIGKKYGVSDNAIRKWCRSYNIPSKTKDYKQCV